MPLTGIHLLLSGEVEPDIQRLSEIFKLNYIKDLVKLKEAEEKGYLKASNIEFYRQEYNRLMSKLEEAFLSTHLPEKIDKEELNCFLIETRLKFKQCNKNCQI